MESISFYKYHGLGNDFVLIDRRESGFPPCAAQWAEELCSRRRGIGADGILFLLNPGEKTGCVAAMRIFNADGSEAEMCGNGLRCVAKHLMDYSGMRGGFLVETGAGVLECSVDDKPGKKLSEVSVEMGRPRRTRAEIPMLGDGELVAETGIFEGIDPELGFTAVSMGNPHLVCFLPEGKPGSVKKWAGELGPVLEVHPLFPNRTNVSFVEMTGENSWNAAVWERGVGLTESCGTGACAIATAACMEGRGELGCRQKVSLPGGDLHIRVDKDYSGVVMLGPAEFVFTGEIRPKGISKTR